MAEFAGIEILDNEGGEEDYGKWLINGPQGTGKTTLASTIATLGRTLFIDLLGERGVRSFRGAPYAKRIDVIRPKSVTEFDDIYWKLAKGDHPYTGVVLDSLTSLQKMALRYLTGYEETAVREIQQGTAPATRQTWGQSLDIMTDTATFWYGLADGDRPHPMHVVMTAQTKMKEDEEGTLRRTIDVQAGALSIVRAAPDYIVYTDVEENPDAISDEDVSPVRHLIRFGADTEYGTKARIPYNLRGKLPPVLGRDGKAVSLGALSRTLGIGGVPTRAAATPKKEQKNG